MFDPSTAALIRSAPPLDDLDRDNLPDQLSATYAKIVTTRLRLRSGEGVDTDELETLIADTRHLAFTSLAKAKLQARFDLSIGCGSGMENLSH